VGLLVETFSIRKAGAQETPELASSPVKKVEQPLYLCATNEKTEAAERATLETYSSPALEKALLSSKSFWDYITDPATPYLDRMAAANRGGSILSPEDLPTLWQAMVEIETVPKGVDPPPCSAIAAINIRPLTTQALKSGFSLNKPREQTTRVILGREIQLPTKNIAFPITAEERDHSPWLWQMERALTIVFTKTNLYYGNPSRYPERVKAAWDWPIPIPTYRPGEVVNNSIPGEWSRIHIRSEALTEGGPHDKLFLQTILKLALNHDNYNVAYSSHVEDLYAWGQDSYHFEELAHVAQIAILQKTKWEDVAARVAFVATVELARYKRDPTNLPRVMPLKTATAILAIGRWATDRSLNPWNRYSSFVVPICRIVDDPPFAPDQLREPEDPRLDERLRSFDAWFEKKKPALEQQAEAELPLLRSLAKELSTDIE